MDSPNEKRAVRTRIIREREASLEAVRRQWNAAITARVLGLPAYRSALNLAAYASFRSEFDTSALIAGALAAGKRVAVPRVSADRERLEFRFIQHPERDLAPGTWGVPEPRIECEPLVDGDGLDLVLLPGVAFTRRGDRVGYGRGYYDRFVAGLRQRPVLVAAAYSMQIVDELPIEPHDRRVDVLVTEGETIFTGKDRDRAAD